jgi:hypothetical protein
MNKVPKANRRQRAADAGRYAARFAVAAYLLVGANSHAVAADLLASVQLVNGGAILSCDYTRSGELFEFTCRDTYAVFALRCVAEAQSAIGEPSNQQDFLCPVPAEPNAFGNALRLRCIGHSARDREYFQARAAGNPRMLLEGRVPTQTCRSAKVNVE